MNGIPEQATLRGIETAYVDAFGRYQVVAAEVLARLVESIPLEATVEGRMLARTVGVRRGRRSRLPLSTSPSARGPGGLIRWEIFAPVRIAGGDTDSPDLELPGDLPVGTFDLRITVETPHDERSESATLLVAPEKAYQGADTNSRMWVLAVQLYAVRSHRNWGYGDFTDLAGLIDIASELGAAGVGLNPLHDVFDASPYSPSSRLFLNPLYIDVDAVPEFAGLRTADMDQAIDRLQRQDVVDYPGVGALKWRALALAHEAFCTSADSTRRRDLDRFRQERGAVLRRFACFELLRRRFGSPWRAWPDPWRSPRDEALDRLYAREREQAEFFEFVQWLADRQLRHCRDRARRVGLSIGLYLDVAVGVRPDGFDAWSDQAAMLPEVAIGAPPDALNAGGQNWGLAAFNPAALEVRKFEPFRHVLEASMRHAGAIRLDHVMGLMRLYLVPDRMPGGAYIRLPFESLLAVIAQESVAHNCIVIGEDLGTVPENFRATLADWGIWSYQVMLFERAADGCFLAPENYRRDAVAAFTTHDLPTFAGWAEGRDLAVKAALAINPGESPDERAQAYAALRAALSERGLAFDFASVARYLAETPSRLLVIAIEDALGCKEQVNVPGTVDERLNWRVRLPVALEDLQYHGALRDLAIDMRSAARSAGELAR